MGNRTCTPWGKDNLIVRPMVALDAHKFAPVIVEDDENEIRALVGLDPLPAFLWAYAISDEAYAAEIEEDGDIIALWGVQNLLVTPSASIWLICSPRIKEHPLTFQRIAKGTLGLLSSRYGALLGVADERNQHHLRWLKSLGFTIRRALPEYGAEKRTFYQFEGVF